MATGELVPVNGAIVELDGIVQEAATALASVDAGHLQKACCTASAMRKIRAGLSDEIMQDVMTLQGTRLGFKTDKTYSVEVVKDCLIEALLRGLYPVGNEFNIIAGNCYTTKEGYTRLLRDYPGLTDLRLMPDVPKSANGGAVVRYRATWCLNGTPDEIDREIPVRVNSQMGIDAILGKAERKIRKAIYDQITGSVTSDGEVDDMGEIMPVANGKGSAALKGKLAEKQPQPEPSAYVESLKERREELDAAREFDESGLRNRLAKCRSVAAVLDVQKDFLAMHQGDSDALMKLDAIVQERIDVLEGN